MSEYSEFIKSTLDAVESQETLAESYKRQIVELTGHMKAAQAKADGLRKDICDMMLAEGDLGPVDIGQHNLTLRRNPPKVVITGNVPQEFIRIREVKEPDKTKIKVRIADGASLDFAHIEQDYSIQLKIKE
jgi:hypothetical protein